MSADLVLRVIGILGTLILAGWLYWLTAKVLLLLTYAEQLLNAAAHLLAVVPSKSAPATPAAEDEAPRVWWSKLRALTRIFVDAVAHEDAEQPAAADPDDVELDRWADDGGRDPDVPTAPPPAHEPATRPVPRIDVAGGLRITNRRPRPTPELDDVDRQLTRFRFAEGHDR